MFFETFSSLAASICVRFKLSLWFLMSSEVKFCFFICTHRVEREWKILQEILYNGTEVGFATHSTITVIDVWPTQNAVLEGSTLIKGKVR